MLFKKSVKTSLHKLQSKRNVDVSDLEAWSHGKPAGRSGRHRRAERLYVVRWRPPPREPGVCEPPLSALGVVPTGQRAPATQGPAEDKGVQIKESRILTGRGRTCRDVEKIYSTEKHNRLGKKAKEKQNKV